MTQEGAKDLAAKLLRACDGYDGTTVITAFGAAASHAVFHGLVDPTQRERAADFFVERFWENIRLLAEAEVTRKQ